MEFAYKKVAVIGRHYRSDIADTVEDIYNYLIGCGLNVCVDVDSEKDLHIENVNVQTLKDIAQSCDIAIVVGGDGGFLKTARLLGLYSDIPIVGVNKGKLGFLTTMNADDKMQQHLTKVLSGKNVKSKMPMLVCKVDHELRLPVETSVALNEIAITSGRGLMFGMRVYINGRYAFDQRGDGLIISTPAGSTAHAMSAGGPILNPNQNSIVLVPICSHSLNSRPLVIAGDSTIEVRITEYNNPEPVLSIDGRHDAKLKSGQKITISKSRHSVTVLHTKGYNYYDTLRKKLGWGKVLF